jgi:hypothetical protein
VGPSESRRREDVIRAAEVRNRVVWTGENVSRASVFPFDFLDRIPVILERFDVRYGFMGQLGAIRSGFNIVGMWLGAYIFRRTKSQVKTTAIFGVAYHWMAVPPMLVLLWQGKEADIALLMHACMASMAMSAVLAAIHTVGHADLLSRMTVTSRRGRITGFASFLSSLVSLAGAQLLREILDDIAFPYNYLAAAVIWLAISTPGVCVILWARRLPESKARSTEETHADLLKSVTVVFQDRRFLLFLIATVPKLAYAAAASFVIPVAQREYGLSDKWVADLLAVSYAASIVQFPISGSMADRWGRGFTALWSAVLISVGMIWFVNVEAAPALLVCYAVMSFGMGATGRMIYLAVLDLSPSDRRQSYVAARYIAESIAMIFFLPIAGEALDRHGTEFVFYGGAAMALATGIIVFVVADLPTRRRNAKKLSD